MRVPADRVLPHNIMSQHTTTLISRCPPETCPQIISPRSEPQRLQSLLPTRESSHHHTYTSLLPRCDDGELFSFYFQVVKIRVWWINESTATLHYTLQKWTRSSASLRNVWEIVFCFFVFFELCTPQITCASTRRPGTFPPRRKNGFFQPFLVCLATTPNIHQSLMQSSFYKLVCGCRKHMDEIVKPKWWQDFTMWKRLAIFTSRLQNHVAKSSRKTPNVWPLHSAWDPEKTQILQQYLPHIPAWPGLPRFPSAAICFLSLELSHEQKAKLAENWGQDQNHETQNQQTGGVDPGKANAKNYSEWI